MAVPSHVTAFGLVEDGGGCEGSGQRWHPGPAPGHSPAAGLWLFPVFQMPGEGG